jgi:hypothetical protein
VVIKLFVEVMLNKKIFFLHAHLKEAIEYWHVYDQVDRFFDSTRVCASAAIAGRGASRIGYHHCSFSERRKCGCPNSDKRCVFIVVYTRCWW